MKLYLGRITFVGLTTVVMSLLFSSCASSEEGDPVFGPPSGGDRDASQDAEAASWGGFGGSGTGGSSGTGGFGGTGTGGFSGTGAAGGTGPSTGGAAGMSGTGGASAAGGTSGGTCNPAFCPNSGVGTPCCVNPNGPCGTNSGSGCVQVGPDF